MITKRRKAELLDQVERVKRIARDTGGNSASAVEDLVEGVCLLAEITASIVRELGPSEHAEAVDVEQARRNFKQ